jgi:hypothetical protein
MQPAKPIKGFVKARAESVNAQLSDSAKGMTIGEFGFGGPGGRGGRGGGPGGPGFSPGMFLGPIFMGALDADKNQSVSKEEFEKGFARWFESWDADKAGSLTEEQMRDGINRDLAPRGFGGPPGPGGPPNP